MAGRPPSISDYEILREVVGVEGPTTVSDLIAELDINRSGMNKRVDYLVSRGLLNEKTVGANAVVYWLSDAGEEFLETHDE